MSPGSTFCNYSALDGLLEALQQALQSEAEVDRAVHTHKDHLRRLKDKVLRLSGKPTSPDQYPMLYWCSGSGDSSPPQTYHSSPDSSPRRRFGSRRSFTDEMEEQLSNAPPDMQLLDFWGRKKRSITQNTGSQSTPLVTAQSTLGRMVSHGKSLLSSNSSETKGALQAGDSVRGQRFHCLVMNPNCRLRAGWDVCSALAIFYDVITVPLLVFGYDQLFMAQVVGMILSLFWMADLCMTFFVGYLREDGGVEMRMSFIARNYLHTWFGLDVTMILADLLVYMLESFQNYADAEAIRLSKTLRTLRIARFLRVLRLTRILKLLAKMEDLYDVMMAASAMAFFNIVKLMLGVAIFAHFIACAWYHIGHSDPNGWVSRLDEEHASVFYRYICAYHWTMAQFTPAPTDFHPKTMWERFYAVLVLFVGFVIFSSLLGSTTALISQARAKVVGKIKATENLRRFFVENQVSLELANRVMKTVNRDLKGKRRVKEVDLIMLKSLPLSVQVELRYQVFAPILAKAPFFGALSEAHPLVVPDLCHSAMQEIAVNLNEELFHFGTRATHMLFIVNGGFMYYPGPMAIYNVEPLAQKVIEGNSVVSEAALWVYWDHRGQLTASSQSDVIKVDADVFRRFVRKNQAYRWLREYAAKFAQLGQELEEGEMDDTWMPFKSVDEVTEMMSGALTGRDDSDRAPKSTTTVRSARPPQTPTLELPPLVLPPPFRSLNNVHLPTGSPETEQVAEPSPEHAHDSPRNDVGIRNTASSTISWYFDSSPKSLSPARTCSGQSCSSRHDDTFNSALFGAFELGAQEAPDADPDSERGDFYVGKLESAVRTDI